MESATTQTGLRLVCLSSPWDEMQSCSSGALDLPLIAHFLFGSLAFAVLCH